MSRHADETYAVYDERYPRARKPHTCEACGETIQPGHRYARVSAIFDGSAETIVRCARCQEIHQHLRTLGRDDDMWPHERLGCGEDYREHWRVEPPDEIAALAFVTAEEAQARLTRRVGET